MKSAERKRKNFREYLKCPCKTGVAVLSGRNTVLLLQHPPTLLEGQLPALLLQINPQQRQLLVRQLRRLIHSLNLNIRAAVMPLLVRRPLWRQLLSSRSSFINSRKSSRSLNLKHLTTCLPSYLIQLLVLPLPLPHLQPR